jgi:putative nucleotidyltransferase with HDIG domain
MTQTLLKLRAINDAARIMNSRLEMNALLDEILSTASHALAFPSFAVLIAEGREGKIVPKRWKGFDDASMRKLSLDQGNQALAQASASGKTRILGSAASIGLPGPNAGGSLILSPMSTEGETSGFLAALCGLEGSFDEDDVEIFSVFSSQAAVSLRNSILHGKALKQNRELAALSKIGSSLNAFTDSDELLKEILVAAQWALGYSQCAILLADPERENLVIKEAYGHDEFFRSGFRFPVGSGVVGEAFTRKERFLVRDVSKDQRYIKITTSSISEMVCPLVVQGEAIGVIDAESSERSFGEEDLVLLSAFAEQVATALTNADMVSRLAFSKERLEANLEDIKRMNEELREYSHKLAVSNEFLEKRVNELQTLYEAGKAFTSSLNLDQTLAAIMNMVKDIISISSGTVVLLDEETSEFKEKVRFEFKAPRETENAQIAGEEGGVEGRIPSGNPEIDIPLIIGDRTIGSFIFASTSMEGISEGDKRILMTLASQAAIAIENARLFESTQNAYFDTISSLARAIETRDPYTKGHSERVTEYASRLVTRLGLPDKDAAVVQYAGLLHDIGKIGISDSILNKTSVLSEIDLGSIREHPLLGDAILSPLRFLQDVQTVVKHHHERWDGAGYPEGLSGEAIPLLARVIAIADAYDAMTTDRPYRKAMSRERALLEIEAGMGGQFDPELASTFVSMMRAG